MMAVDGIGSISIATVAESGRDIVYAGMYKDVQRCMYMYVCMHVCMYIY